jgi:hypothetical protein
MSIPRNPLKVFLKMPGFRLLAIWMSLLLSGAFLQSSTLLAARSNEVSISVDFEDKSGEEFVSDTPAPFVYDPLSQTSRANKVAWRTGNESQPFRYDCKLGGSFTVECFVKPYGSFDLPFVKKTRRSDKSTEFGLKLDHFQAHNQFYFRSYAVSGTQPIRRFPCGHYGSSAQYMGEKDNEWRHLAMVYDAENGAVTTYIDYYLFQTEKVQDRFSFDDGPIEVGTRGSKCFIDEVRISSRKLSVAEFLRGVSRESKGLRFASQHTIVPDAANCVDIKAHFGAVGDGVTDDSDAFEKAFRVLCSRVPLAYNTLLIPEGTYLITRTIQGGRFIDVKGAGPNKSVLKLKDNTFLNPKEPQPILRMSSSQSPPGSYKGVNGSSISVYLDGLTLDVGSNNPGARGIEYHANNVGRLENVVIRSGDGQGVCGLDLTHHDCGPALVKNVTVEGFAIGIQSRYQEYSMTFEHIRLEKQSQVGILNEGNILAIRGLRSKNEVSAIESRGANSMIVLLDSELQGLGRSDVAIRSEGGLLIERSTTPGYRKAIFKRDLIDQKDQKWREESIAGPELGEYIADQVVVGFGTRKSPLRLPILETPIAPEVPASNWVNVLEFESLRKGSDWSPVVQAAIDSGARVIYVPCNARLEFFTPIVLRGNVERIIGFGAGWNWHPTVWNHRGHREQTDRAKAPPPLLVFDDVDSNRTVWIERLSVESVRHASAGTLVLYSSSPGYYEAGPGNGRLFAEDIGGADWHFDHPQQVWVRQWNPESHAAGPCIHSQGATIWSLGFKTEYESQKILAEKNAQTEILGAFIYPIGKIPEDRPIFENRDSRMSLVYGTSVYASNHKVHIRDTKGEETKEYGNSHMKWAGSRARMDLFVSE